MKEVQNVTAWLVGRIPDTWFERAPSVEGDRDEILVVGELAEPTFASEMGDEDKGTARRSRIEGWREETRQQRMEIARQAEGVFDRTVSWGARCGGEEALFTTLAAPAMTRLRLAERRVLDTLISAGVARSRSEALAWCVRLVDRNQDEWLDELRHALKRVNEVRHRGPEG